jgi:hypothetical protein
MKPALTLLVALPLLAQSPQQLEFFETKIRPIFATKCYGCHGPKTQTAGLDFSSGSGLGEVIVKGDPAQSRLYQAISYTERIKMPPPGKLAEHEIADLQAWIDMGAPWPAETRPAAAPITLSESKRIEEGRKHWAFQPVRDYAPPQVKNEAWVKTPIDRFILAKLEEKGIRPATPATKLTLLRRVTYDLTGLPPTAKEIAAFLADKAPDAYARVVDRLLASPRYGERWGRHWLDVARYADSTGMDEDHLYPNAWRFRDYVVRAFNDDMPYDRFITEQLAGDLVPETGERGIIATGFLALGPKPLAQQDRIKMIYDTVDEQIDTTSKAFLGLTIACARCHDHKFDPILTKDYYSLASIFASTVNFRNFGRTATAAFPYDAPIDASAYGNYQAHRWRMYGKQLEMEEFVAQDWAREYGLLRPKLASLLTAAWKVEVNGSKPADAASAESVEAKQVEKWSRWLHAADAEARKGYLKKLLEATSETIGTVAREYQERYNKTGTAYDAQVETWRRRFANEVLEDRDLPPRPKPPADPFFAATTFNGGPMELADSGHVAELRAEWKQLQATLPPPPAMASGVCDGPSIEQRVFLRGDNNSPGELVAKQFPVVLAGTAQKPVTKGSGRLQLAKWLTVPDNPLTARVMVNRIWQWHFGEALLRTPNNWGKMAETPTHPELLDWLARRFVEGGWSIKALHRTILLSSVYQMDSHVARQVREADPANRLWSRFDRVRMSAEEIRDSLLVLGGNLDTTMGGSLLGSGTRGRQRVDPDDVNRRTLYLPVRRDSIPTMLATFDFGDATTASDGRARTNVAPQALFMLNSRFVMEQAGRFAGRLLDDATLPDKERIEHAYLMALARRPEPDETDSALTYLDTLEKRLNQPDGRQTAWRSFCHVLLSTNEFLYLN